MTGWRFDSLELDGGRACVALCPCPGRRGALAEDLRLLHEWGARALVTLVEDHELTALGVAALPDILARLGMRWWHLPVRDMAAPDARFETLWDDAGPELHRLLGDGTAIALHCHGGLGRTGTVAARLLVEMGEEPVSAIARVRRTRPGSIETAEQERYVLALGAGR